jgi:CheY-like chemotaxis protein
MATARSILVVTATSGFGALIQHTLEETGLYKVMVVDSDQEALLCIQTVSFTIAILDAELPGGNMVFLVNNMREKLPKMRLVIICAQDDPAYQVAQALHPQGLLSKPFYLPELLDSVAKALQISIEPVRSAPVHSNPPAAPARFTEPAAPEWLQDANWAAQHLTRLSLESAAQAALIVREGELWAYAGGFSQIAAQELAEHLTSFWDNDADFAAPGGKLRGRRGDIVRFLRLEATDGEYMLYATSLGQGMLLSLVFDSDTPFSTIRAQAGYLARAFSAPPGATLPPYPKTHSGMLSPLSLDENGEPSPPIKLPPLLEDVPPPSPYRPRQSSTPNASRAAWVDVEQAIAVSPEETVPTHPTEMDPGLITPNPVFEPGISTRIPDPIQKPVLQTEIKNPTNGAPLMAPDLFPPTPTLHYLTYSCTLIPRLPQHQLSGDLAQRLKEWMPQLFLAFGWQLLETGVHPEYFQVSARITPNTSPGMLVRTIRQQTSKRIFTVFPYLAEENPSGDFWAPGYLILSSSQPPPSQVTQHFIEQTRQQQGLRQTDK